MQLIVFLLATLSLQAIADVRIETLKYDARARRINYELLSTEGCDRYTEKLECHSESQLFLIFSPNCKPTPLEASKLSSVQTGTIQENTVEKRVSNSYELHQFAGTLNKCASYDGKIHVKVIDGDEKTVDVPKSAILDAEATLNKAHSGSQGTVLGRDRESGK